MIKTIAARWMWRYVTL